MLLEIEADMRADSEALGLWLADGLKEIEPDSEALALADSEADRLWDADILFEIEADSEALGD